MSKTVDAANTLQRIPAEKLKGLRGKVLEAHEEQCPFCKVRGGCEHGSFFLVVTTADVFEVYVENEGAPMDGEPSEE